MKKLTVLFKTKPNTMRSLLLVVAILIILPLLETAPLNSSLINPFNNLPAYLCLLGSIILGVICWVKMQTNPSFWPAILTIISLAAVLLIPSLICQSLLVTATCFFCFGLLGIWGLFVLIELDFIDGQLA